MMGQLVTAVTDCYSSTPLHSIPEHRATTDTEHVEQGSKAQILARPLKSRMHSARSRPTSQGTHMRKALLGKQQSDRPMTGMSQLSDWSHDDSDATLDSERSARRKSQMIARSLTKKRATDADRFPHQRLGGEAYVPSDEEDNHHHDGTKGIGATTAHSHRSKRSRTEIRGGSSSAATLEGVSRLHISQKAVMLALSRRMIIEIIRLLGVVMSTLLLRLRMASDDVDQMTMLRTDMTPKVESKEGLLISGSSEKEKHTQSLTSAALIVKSLVIASGSALKLVVDAAARNIKPTYVPMLANAPFVQVIHWTIVRYSALEDCAKWRMHTSRRTAIGVVPVVAWSMLLGIVLMRIAYVESLHCISAPAATALSHATALIAVVHMCVQSTALNVEEITEDAVEPSKWARLYSNAGVKIVKGRSRSTQTVVRVKIDPGSVGYSSRAYYLPTFRGQAGAGHVLVCDDVWMAMQLPHGIQIDAGDVEGYLGLVSHGTLGRLQYSPGLVWVMHSIWAEREAPKAW